MGRWFETYQTPEEILMGKIKTVSLSVIAKFKAENPDFDMDFESFAKELSTDDTQLTRLFEILIKDSYKRTRRLSRSSSQTHVATSPGGPGEARFARLIQQHQQQRLAIARQAVDQDQQVTVDGTRYRIARSRSPMDIDGPADRETRPIRVSADEANVSQSGAPREEDKDDEGTFENREIGLGTVVVA